MKNGKNLPGRSFAVVTGASSGIGYELAKQFAQNGFDLLVMSSGEGIVRAAEELSGFGAKVTTLKVDLATYDGVEAAYDKIRACGRPVDAIALNAGVGVGGKFLETELKDELNLIRLNIVSPVHLAKRVGKDMAERGEGKILFTSSLASTMPGPYYAVYAASKAFIQSFSIAIREELKETGVTVTALLPGATDTHFFARADMEHTPAGESKKDDPAQVAKDGFEALMAGKDQVVAGSFLNKVQAVAARIMPESLQAKVHGTQIKPKDENAA